MLLRKEPACRILLMLGALCFTVNAQNLNTDRNNFYNLDGTVKEFMRISQDNAFSSLLDDEAEFLNILSQNQFLYGFRKSLSLLNDPLSNGTSECARDLDALLMGLTHGQMWAISMIDAWGKLPSGLLLGNVKWIGKYDYCLSLTSGALVRSKGDDSNKTTPTPYTTPTPPSHFIKGQYCSLDLGNPASNITNPYQMFLLGLCLPHTCSEEDVTSIVNFVLTPLKYVKVLGARCTTGEREPLSKAAIVVISVLGAYIGILVICTLCDLYLRYHCKKRDDFLELSQEISSFAPDANLEENNESDNNQDNNLLLGYNQPHLEPEPPGVLHKLATALSLYTSACSILKIDSKINNKSLPALHGIRFLSMSWVILGHSVLVGALVLENPLDMLAFFKRYLSQAIINAHPSVDTFFLLSGLLVSYLLLTELNHYDGSLFKFSWHKFYFHRFWRLSPLYYALLALFTCVFTYTGEGPLWYMDSVTDPCQTNWWTNVLYINSFVKLDQQCMGWTWYLGNDMWFFIFSPFLILLLYKLPIVGLSTSVLLMISNCITVGVISTINHYPPGVPAVLNNNTPPFDTTKWNDDLYWVPWTRYSPYVVGITLGYIIFRYREGLKMHWSVALLGWFLAAACNISIIYGLYGVANDAVLSQPVASLYAALQRTGWSLGVAWVIFACVTGFGGFVNTLLSFKPFVVLSRLSYAAYLVHVLVLAWFSGTSRVPIYFSTNYVICNFLSMLTLSYAAAFVVSVCFEAPMIALERAFWRQRNA